MHSSRCQSALLVMDMQNSVVSRYIEHENELLPFQKALETARRHSIPVIFVRVAFREGYPEISARNKMFGGIAGRSGGAVPEAAMRIHSSLQPRPGEPIVTKLRVGAFTGSDLEVILRANEIDTLILSGIATSGVVLSTLREAADEDFVLKVLADACLDADPEVHRVLIDKVFPLQAEVISVDQWADSLAVRPEAQDEKKEKAKKYSMLNQLARKGQTVFAGSSLMEFFPINELQQTLDRSCCLYNRGIAGFVTAELLESLEACIFELEPSNIFINIGTNDISAPDYKLERLLAGYDEILTRIARRLPDCQVYVMAYYPVNAKAEFPFVPRESMEEVFRNRTNEAIREANQAIELLAAKHGYAFIDVNEGLADAEGNLKKEYSVDGIHLLPSGYAIVWNNLNKYL
ncbi:isochorismatase family protein [Paenibacillus sp. D51F]